MRSKSRKRLTVGLMMALVAVSALASWAYEDSRRIRVIFENRSASPVRSVTVNYAGRERDLGPVAPGSVARCRIPAPPGEPVGVAFVVQGPPGREDRRILAPKIVAGAAGSSILVGFDEPQGSVSLKGAGVIAAPKAH